MNSFTTPPLAILCLLALLAGCGTPQPAPVSTTPADGKQVFTRPTWTTSSVGDPPRQTGTTANPTANPTTDAVGGGAGQASAKRTTWSILLGVATGPGADRQAATLAAIATREGRMTGTFLEHKGDGFAVLYGEYEEPGSIEAKKDLAAARAVDVGGAKPFEGAIMAAPVVRGAAGTTPEHDLRLAKQLFGAKKAKYTLQVGIYARSDREKPTKEQVAEFRKAAEEAVKVFRAQGEQSFYYHGTERSTVTVGLFATDDDPAIKALQKRFPNHMINGQTTTNAKAEQQGGVKGQPCIVVEVR